MPVRDAAPGDSGATGETGETYEPREFQIEQKRAQELARRAAWSGYGYALRCPMNGPLRLQEGTFPDATRSSGLAVTLDLLSRFEIGVRFRTH